MECRTAAMKIPQAPMSAEGKGKPLGAWRGIRAIIRTDLVQHLRASPEKLTTINRKRLSRYPRCRVAA
jgi:hypothetical protein